MAEMTHCDGPDCEKSKATYGHRMLCEEPWVSLSQGRDDVDFCGRTCAIAWLTEPHRTRDKGVAKIRTTPSTEDRDRA